MLNLSVDTWHTNMGGIGSCKIGSERRSGLDIVRTRDQGLHVVTVSDAETRRIWRPRRNFQHRTLMRLDSHRCVLGRWRFSDFPRLAFSWIVSIQWDVKHVGDSARLKSSRPLSHWISPDGKLETNDITFCLFIPQVIYQTLLNLLARPY